MRNIDMEQRFEKIIAEMKKQHQVEIERIKKTSL